MEKAEFYKSRNGLIENRTVDTELVQVAINVLESHARDSGCHALRIYNLGTIHYSPLGIITHYITSLERFQEQYGVFKWISTNVYPFNDYITDGKMEKEEYFLPNCVAQALGMNKYMSFPITIKRRTDDQLITDYVYWTSVFDLTVQGETYGSIANYLKTYVLGDGFTIIGE